MAPKSKQSKKSDIYTLLDQQSSSGIWWQACTEVEGKKAKPAAPQVDQESVSAEELMEKLRMLEKEKNKEEEYRNYMQLERDKINSFWEITKRDLDDRKTDLRNKDREMEDMEERHQVEIKVYKQKVKHLLYEHENSIATVKADGEVELKLQQDDNKKKQFQQDRDKWFLKQELRETELGQQEFTRQLNLDHAKEITKLRQDFELQARELQQKHERKMKNLREDLELKRKQEIHEIEERKNAHTNDLIKQHEKAFNEMKNYYNDITHNNLDLIKALKVDVSEMKKKEAQNEKLMYELAQENRKLSNPLQKAFKQVDQLQQQLQMQEKEKQNLYQVKARLASTEKQVKALDWEKEVLHQKFLKIESERDELFQNFEQGIYDQQQKYSLKVISLEKRIEALCNQLEKKETQLAEILTIVPVDQNYNQLNAQQVGKKIDEIIDQKNNIIKALQFDIAKVSKAHNDLIKVYEAKLQEYGIPVDELGFRPLLTKITPGPTLVIQ